jgi:hypothetical protein
MSAHAMLSPSGAHRWMVCPGSVVLEAGQPDSSSSYADEGTDAHQLASMCLTKGTHPAGYIGQKMDKGTIVDVDMAGHVNTYVQQVRDISAAHTLLVEQQVPIGHITEEAGATGTADAIIVSSDGRELMVVDLKFGRGVEVSAERNAQLMLYALGALHEHDGLSGDFETVRMIISQPRLNNLSEWSCSVGELREFGVHAAHYARKCHTAQTYGEKWSEVHHKYLSPGEDQCRFCKAKAVCPALSSFVEASVGGDFEAIAKIEPATGGVESLVPMDTDLLGAKMAAIDLIEDWCKAVRAKTEANLLSGVSVAGYKLVQGKRGNRAWTSAEEAEKTLKSMRLKIDEMYEFKLISPTTAEKLLKETPRRWAKVLPLIGQSDGRPSVAKTSDKRPALVVTPIEEDFADCTKAETVDDLL